MGYSIPHGKVVILPKQQPFNKQPILPMANAVAINKAITIPISWWNPKNLFPKYKQPKKPMSVPIIVGKRNDAIAAPVVANSIRVNHSEKFQPFLYP